MQNANHKYKVVTQHLGFLAEIPSRPRPRAGWDERGEIIERAFLPHTIAYHVFDLPISPPTYILR
jgi:hypothetical protein